MRGPWSSATALAFLLALSAGWWQRELASMSVRIFVQRGVNDATGNSAPLLWPRMLPFTPCVARRR